MRPGPMGPPVKPEGDENERTEGEEDTGPEDPCPGVFARVCARVCEDPARDP